jgi:hypothetical protein
MSIDYPDIGRIYYNGFMFPGAITARINTVPVYDTTGRYVKYRQHTVTVEFIIYPGVDAAVTKDPIFLNNYTPIFPTTISTVNSGYMELRRRLTEPGQPLSIQGLGFGTDIVVASSDVNFGPRPSLLSWEPLGGPKGVRVVWECSFAVTECTTPTAVRGDIGELSFDVEWSIDVMGLTTRTVTGFADIRVARVGNIISNHADQIRDQLRPPAIPINFGREHQNYHLSADRRRLAFTIVDREHPSDNPLSPGCVRMDVIETVSTSLSKSAAGNIWTFQIDGTITVAKGMPRWFAWVAFIGIVKSRREIAKQFATVNKSGEPDFKSTTKSNILTTAALSLTEEIYGRSMSFSWVWWMFCDVGSIIDASGFWQAIPGQSWELWQASMAEAWHPRGAAGLKHQGPDYVISFCDKTGLVATTPESRDSKDRRKPASLLSDKPDPANSWMFFPHCEYIEDSYIHSLYPLGGTEKDEFSVYDPNITEMSIKKFLSKEKPTQYQQRGETRYRVIFSGHATRFGYEIPMPQLVEYGGVKAHRTNTPAQFSVHHRRGPDGFMIYFATWRIEYSLARKPESTSYSTIKPDYRKFSQ